MSTTTPGLTQPPSTQPAAPVTPLNVIPRVDLLPAEIGQRNRSLVVQRWLRAAMVIVLILVAAAVAGAWVLATAAQSTLSGERNTTVRLQGELAKYADVQNAIDAVAIGKAAVVVGGSTEVDWQDYLNRVLDTLPSGVRVQSFTIDAASIVSQYPQSETPLQGARVATLEFQVTSPDLPRVREWLLALATLPGYVDATPGSSSLGDNGYDVSMTMHVDAQAYSNRVLLEQQQAALEGEDQ